MADSEIENALGFTDVRRKQGDSNTRLAATATYTDVAAMRTYLAASTAHGVGYYTTARLNNLTKNDMAMAIRHIQDATGVK